MCHRLKFSTLNARKLTFILGCEQHEAPHNFDCSVGIELINPFSAHHIWVRSTRRHVIVQNSNKNILNVRSGSWSAHATSKRYKYNTLALRLIAGENKQKYPLHAHPRSLKHRIHWCNIEFIMYLLLSAPTALIFSLVHCPASAIGYYVANTQFFVAHTNRNKWKHIRRPFSNLFAGGYTWPVTQTYILALHYIVCFFSVWMSRRRGSFQQIYFIFFHHPPYLPVIFNEIRS